MRGGPLINALPKGPTAYLLAFARSRFGKFMKLQFNAQGYLHGAYTINYLLERSRVVGVAGVSLF